MFCFRLFVLTFILTILSSSAYANVKALSFYVGAKLGYSHYLPSSFRSNQPGTQDLPIDGSDSALLGVTGGIAYKFIPQLGIRTELEYAYRTPSTKVTVGNGSSTDKFQVQTHTILTNVYLDYYVLPALNLYISTGIGVSMMDGKIVSPGEPDISAGRTRFAAQGGIGAAYTFSNNLVLDINIRYAHFGQYRVRADSDRATMSGVETIVGLAYKF